MVKKHKVQVNFYICDKSVKNGLSHCNIEFWQNSNLSVLINDMKKRATEKHAHKFMMFNDGIHLTYVKHKSLWYKVIA